MLLFSFSFTYFSPLRLSSNAVSEWPVSAFLGTKKQLKYICRDNTCIYLLLCEFPHFHLCFFNKNEKLLKMALKCYPLLSMYFYFKIAQSLLVHWKVLLGNCFHFYIKFWHNLAFMTHSYPYNFVYRHLNTSYWEKVVLITIFWTAYENIKEQLFLSFQAKRH